MRSRPLIAAFLFGSSLGLLQCSNGGGGAKIGAPCTPALENDPAFTGFKVTEETIETGAPECGGGVCLVNHFQGRVSCPLGQPAPAGAPGGGCQAAGADPTANAGKACCGPAGANAVTTSVCGQCAGVPEETTRDAASAVYCTCRCGVADGSPDEPDYDFCSCPDGFECSEIRKNFGLGDTTLTGKYCILQGTAYDPNKDQCGEVNGYWEAGSASGLSCVGVGTGKCLTPDGPCP